MASIVVINLSVDLAVITEKVADKVVKFYLPITDKLNMYIYIYIYILYVCMYVYVDNIMYLHLI